MYLAGGNYDAYTNPQSSFGRGRNPISGGQFGQTQIGQVSGPSLEEVLSQRGFKVPEKPTGVMHQAMVMYKDPITGKMQSGGAHGASHANAMSKFYEQNPEALDIAKQHQKGQQFQGSGPTTSIGDSLRPPQEIMPQPIRDRRARMDIHLAPPTRPSMGNPSGSLGGQIRPNPYSAPPQMGGGFGGQMGGGMGGGQGMGQFMQFMQTMSRCFNSFKVVAGEAWVVASEGHLHLCHNSSSMGNVSRNQHNFEHINLFNREECQINLILTTPLVDINNEY